MYFLQKQARLKSESKHHTILFVFSLFPYLCVRARSRVCVYEYVVKNSNQRIPFYGYSKFKAKMI